MNHKYVYLLAMGHFFCDIALGALPALFPFFISQYGMNYKDVGGLMFASCFLSSVIQPVFGWLADKKSKSWFMPLGILLAGTAMGLTGLLENYWLIFAAIMLSGIGSAIFHPEAACMVNKVSGNKRGTALSIFSVGGNSGFAVGPVVAIAAVTAFGMSGTSVLCLLAIVMSILLMTVVPKMKKEIAQTEHTKAQALQKNIQTTKAVQNDWRAFSRLVVMIMCISVVVCGLRSFIPMYWVTVLGLSNAASGSALTLLFALGVVTTMVGGLLADRFGYLKIVRTCYILLFLSIGLLSQTRNITLGYLLLIPMGFAMFAPFSSVVVLGQTYLARSIGFASGVTMGLFFSVGGVIVPLIGNFADVNGLMATLELLSAAALFAAIAAFFLPTPVKKGYCCEGESL